MRTATKNDMFTVGQWEPHTWLPRSNYDTCHYILYDDRLAHLTRSIKSTVVRKRAKSRQVKHTSR